MPKEIFASFGVFDRSRLAFLEFFIVKNVILDF